MRKLRYTVAYTRNLSNNELDRISLSIFKRTGFKPTVARRQFENDSTGRYCSIIPLNLESELYILTRR